MLVSSPFLEEVHYSCVPVMERWPLENSGTISIKGVEEAESMKD